MSITIYSKNSYLKNVISLKGLLIMYCYNFKIIPYKSQHGQRDIQTPVLYLQQISQAPLLLISNYLYLITLNCVVLLLLNIFTYTVILFNYWENVTLNIWLVFFQLKSKGFHIPNKLSIWFGGK